MKRHILFGIGATFSLAFAAIAQDAVPDHTLDEFKLGEHVSGDKVDLSKAKGKVVTIEYWGTR
ncbi:MAG: hypothetical protein HKN23_15055 [Verrucomicrobiales bacterium]|nr:hypothetical protein [Verrucomicrobiales bacterium]